MVNSLKVFICGHCFLPSAAAAELWGQLLLRACQLGWGQSKRRCRAAQEVHPGAARPSSHRWVPQHLQRCQRSVYTLRFSSFRCDSFTTTQLLQFPVTFSVLLDWKHFIHRLLSRYFLWKTFCFQDSVKSSLTNYTACQICVFSHLASCTYTA